MLADIQKRPNGGDGWLRLIRFLPSSRQIQVRTYSPVLDKFETDQNSRSLSPVRCRRLVGENKQLLRTASRARTGEQASRCSLMMNNERPGAEAES
jgi:hypothetical protein